VKEDWKDRTKTYKLTVITLVGGKMRLAQFLSDFVLKRHSCFKSGEHF
jgi:hypothetical protein